MTISEVIKRMEYLRDKYGELQIAVRDHEFNTHDTVFSVELAKKKDDSPFEINDSLNDVFFSIHCCY